MDAGSQPAFPSSFSPEPLIAKGCLSVASLRFIHWKTFIEHLQYTSNHFLNPRVITLDKKKKKKPSKEFPLSLEYRQPSMDSV